jgi:hypothetical protein
MAPPYHFPRARRILELPVYRCTEKQYYREQNAQYEAEAQSIEQSFQHTPDKDDPVMRARHREYMEYYKKDWHTRYERPWDFNEIVAWIRLYARSDAIGASLFLMPYKRMPKGMRYKRRRDFKWDSNNFLDMWVDNNQSSVDIFNELRTLLATTVRQRFKRWYVDIGVLDVLGPNLNWVALTRDFHQQPAAPRSSDEEFP